MKIVVAISGASGVVLGKRLVEILRDDRTELHVIISSGAMDVAAHEDVDLKSLYKYAKIHSETDMFSELASSSNIVDAMIIVPCSMKTLSAVANGYANTLIVRSAENVLKMGKKLIVVPRDTPLSLAAIENMRKLKLAGAIILPPIVAYYFKPKKIEDITDFIVGKILDVLGIEHKLYTRWNGKT